MSTGLGGVATILTSNIALQDEDRGDLYTGRLYWNYQHRGSQSNRDQGAIWCSLWPASRMCSGDPTAPLTSIGQDGRDVGASNLGFEQWSYGEGGQLGQSFIRGKCVDVNGNALAACTIEAYVTNAIAAGNPNGNFGNVLAGTTTSDSNGNFACPTPYPGVAHYCVAYYSATNLAGTTVNTLIPTN